MSQAIWALLYSIAADHQSRYLDWFHGVHVPEKLARPGYTWAAHYAQASGADAPSRGYIALFGGSASRVFYDPSPSQLRARQDALTREMMGCRIDGRSIIYTEQWCEHGAAGPCPAGTPVHDAVIRLECCDALGHDEALQAWYAQEHVKAISTARGCTGVRNWLASSDSPRHAIVQGFTDVATCEAANRAGAATALAVTVGHPFGAPRIGTRVWPPRADPHR